MRAQDHLAGRFLKKKGLHLVHGGGESGLLGRGEGGDHVGDGAFGDAAEVVVGGLAGGGEGEGDAAAIGGVAGADHQGLTLEALENAGQIAGVEAGLGGDGLGRHPARGRLGQLIEHPALRQAIGLPQMGLIQGADAPCIEAIEASDGVDMGVGQRLHGPMRSSIVDNVKY